MAQPRKLHDAYFKRAKAEGYAARSAYKLKEIAERKRVICPGDVVLDLGCAPGSWMQVAGEIVGPRGVVVGLDLQETAATLPANAVAVRGDVFQAGAGELLALTARGGAAPRAFNVVLSDMAPNTTGAGDHFRSVDLCNRVLDLLPGLLRRGGNLVMKVFEGELYPELLARTAGLFERVKGFKPEASRDASREMYIVAHAYKAGGARGGGTAA